MTPPHTGPRPRFLAVVALLVALGLTLLWAVANEQPPAPGEVSDPTRASASTGERVGDPTTAEVPSTPPDRTALGPTESADLDRFTIAVTDLGTRAALAEVVVTIRSVTAPLDAADADSLQRSETDPRGEVTFACPPTHAPFGGTLHVTLEADGYATLDTVLPRPAAGSRWPLAMGAAPRMVVRVESALEGAPLADAALHLRRRHPTLLTATADGPRGRALHAFDADTPSARTEADGRAVLAGHPAGLYLLTVTATDHAAALDVPLEIRSGAEETTIRLEPGHRVEVEVVTLAGDAVVGLPVDFVTDALSLRRRTDSEGRATSPALAAGTRVTVTASRPDLAPVARLWEGLLEPLREIVTLPHPGRVRLVLPDERQRTRLLDVRWPATEAGDRIELTMFQQLDGAAIGKVDFREVDGAAGRTELGALRAGTFRIHGVGTDSGLWSSPRFDVAGDGPLSVRLDQTVTRDASLAVSVAPGRGGLGPARIVLSARDQDLGIASAVADRSRERAEPRAELRSEAQPLRFDRLLPGRYTVEAQWPGPRLIARSEVELRAGAVEHIELEPVAPGILEGRVIDLSTDRPMLVRAIDVAAHRAHEAGVDQADGTFRFDELAPGRYRVGLAHLAGAGTPPHLLLAALRGDDSTGTPVEVRAGETTRCEIRDALTGRHLTVHATDRPPIGSELWVFRMVAHDRVGRHRHVLTMPLDASDTATMTGLDPDAHWGVALRSPDHRWIAWTQLAPGTGPARIELHRAVTVSVRLDRAADPARSALVPVDSDGTPFREIVLRPDRLVDGVAWFDSAPAGSYLAVGNLQGDRLGRIDAAVRVVAVPPTTEASLR